MAEVTVCDYCGKYPWTSGVLDATYYQSEDITLIQCKECGQDVCDICLKDGAWASLESCCIETGKKNRKA